MCVCARVFVSTQGVTYPRSVQAGTYGVPVGAPTRHVDVLPCPPGSYCTFGVQTLCPAGTYGASVGLPTKDCDGPCAPGYYCLDGATNATQYPCGGDDVYCVAGSSSPRAAQPGDRTIGGDPWNKTDVEPCPSGSYCVNGTALLCPPGRFGCASGLGLPDCNGACAAGFYCPAGAVSSHVHECGGAQYYCPDGSGAPTPVLEGYYSVGGVSTMQQTAQALCPNGTYCADGVKVTHGVLRGFMVVCSGRVMLYVCLCAAMCRGVFTRYTVSRAVALCVCPAF